MPKRIAIIEDDRDVADLVEHYLRKEGYVAEQFHDGEKALKKLRTSLPDLAVLDLMLPGMDGLEICRALRADTATKYIPIIMLTAKGEETDRILGLEMGADDYVTKPFSPKELMSRIKAVLRRGQATAQESAVLSYGSLTLNSDRHTVIEGKKEISLTAKEFSLLRHLMQRVGRLCSREQLLDAVWGDDFSGADRTVDVHIRHLREKIPMLATAIVTVKSFGYKLQERR
jgi:two-component system, OmpR family, alkaline phosphatase synthesis response regulator PhoP